MTGLSKSELADYVSRQLNHFFPDGNDPSAIVNKNIDDASDRMSFSLKHTKLRGYTAFDVLHSDLYAQFIYFLSNTVWKNDQEKRVAIKLYYLNKALHGINCMFDTELPNIFLLIHCVGTMLGKANYSDYFVACHNVTVGTDKGEFPRMERGIYLGPGSSIIGNCVAKEFTHLAINAVVLNQDTEGSCIIVGSSPNIQSKKLKRNLITDQYFKLEE